MTPRLSYLICTSPRSGSWVLGEWLKSTGVAGDPKEWFNDAPGEASDDNMESYFCKEWGIPLPLVTYEPYLAKVIEYTTTANGVFGLTSHRDQFTAMETKLKTIPSYRGLTAQAAVEKAFLNLRYIRLIRRDKIRQAISYYRASKTSVWHIKTQQPAAAQPAPQFDPAEIAKWERVFEHHDASWKKYFDECGQEPLVVYYEDLEKDYVRAVKTILEYLDIPGIEQINVAPPVYKKLADATTEDWAQRYLAHKRGKPAAGKAPPPTIPPTWKRWIAENKLLNIPDRTLLDILKKNGINEQMALEELQAIDANPYFQGANSYTQLLHKRESFAMIQRALGKCDPKTGAVERRSGVSRADFVECYYAANRPVILCDLMTGWKASERWTPDYLKATCGNVMVEIMADRDKNPSYEINDAKHRRTVRFGDYVDMVTSSNGSNDYYLTARNEFFKSPEVRPLLQDMGMFPEYLDDKASGMFLWYGPKDTVTPLHHDAMNIFMAQVQGRKRITLVPAAEMDLVYNNNGVYSPIDVENPDYDRFPKFREATVITLELAPGEVLFLPVGWWHHVRALDTSITVTFMNFLFLNQFDWVHPKAR